MYLCLKVTKLIGFDQSVRQFGHVQTLMKDEYIMSACGGCESCIFRYNCDIFHWFIRVGKRFHITRSFRVPNGYIVSACYSGVGMDVDFCLSVEFFSCQNLISTCRLNPTVARTDWGDA